MEVEYTLEVDDALAFYRYHFTYGPMHHRPETVRWWSLVVLSVLVAVLLGMDVLLFGEISTLSLILLGLVAFLVVVTVVFQMAQLGLIERRLRRLYRGSEGKGEFQPRRLSMSPDGLTTVTEYTCETRRWPGIEKIVSTESYVFFYTSPTAALIVPKRAFADDWRFTEFVEQACRYHEASRPTTG